MALNREEILVIVKNKVEGAEELAKEGKLVSTLNSNTGELTRTFETQTATERRRLIVKEKTLDNGEKQVKTNTETLAQGPEFQAHFLGLMFGGMALNRAMSNLTATSTEWVGIGELMSTTMGVVMLPAALELLDTAILPLMDALLGLPEETKMAIGVTVFGLQGVGKIAEIAGQVALGAIAFPGAAAMIKKNFKAIAMKSLFVTAGAIITIASIQMIATGIEEDSLAKELGGILGTGLGLGLIGLTLGGPVGGLIGFTLGVSIGLIISWFISKNELPDDIENFGDKSVQERADFIFSTSRNFLENAQTRTSSVASRALSNFNNFVPEGGSSSIDNGVSSINNKNNGGNISIVNNIKVDDKNEFLRMIQQNNQSIIREVRRDAT